MTSKRKQRRTAGDGFVDVRRNGRLLFRYDPKRGLVEIKPKGTKTIEVVDLQKLAD